MQIERGQWGGGEKKREGPIFNSIRQEKERRGRDGKPRISSFITTMAEKGEGKKKGSKEKKRGRGGLDRI